MKGRTYRYFSGAPLYSFGYGLSYTSFRYSNASLSRSRLHAGEPLDVSVQLENSGGRDGDETVEAYVIPKAEPGRPIDWLAAFEKIHLLKGETKTVRLTVDSRELSLVDADGNRSVEPGDYELYVGGGQPSTKSGVFLPFHIEGRLPLAP